MWEPEEACLLDEYWSRPETDGGFENGVHRGWRSTRTTWFRRVFLVALAVIIGKLWIMQVVQAGQWREDSERALILNNALPAPRGTILDRDGRSYAANDPEWIAVVTPYYVEDFYFGPWQSPMDEVERDDKGEQRYPDPPPGFETIAYTVADIVNSSPSRTADPPAADPVDPYEIIDTLCDYSFDPYRQAAIATDLDHEAVMRLAERFHELPGLEVVRRHSRSYGHPHGSSAFHLIGYVGLIFEDQRYLYNEGYGPSDVIGKEGVEAYYEKLLRGRKGRQVIRPDRQPMIDRPPLPGHDITLHIDARIQAAMEASLARHVEANEGDAGAAVAMDPHTGAIYALASYPSFESEWFLPDHPPEYDNERIAIETNQPKKRLPYQNHVTKSKRAPASTFKIVSLTAALEEGVIDPNYHVYCTGHMELGTIRYCWRKEGHGGVGVTRSLAESCNIFYYNAGVKLGQERLLKWAHRFGFGEETGIDLPGEHPGLVGDEAYLINQLGEDGWFDGHSANMAIGQGPIEATTLQVGVMTALIANGSKRVVPHVVARITDAGEPIPPIKREKEPTLIDLEPTTLDYVRSGMRGVVEWQHGTAHYAFSGENSVPVAVAGKTGSSEVGSDDAWFTCYAPYVNMNPSRPNQVERANNAPEIVVTALIINGGHGSDSAAPVARDVIRAAYDDNGNFIVSPHAGQ
jgi:penicillin-binding protein 2